jgi:hypothetical protein
MMPLLSHFVAAASTAVEAMVVCTILSPDSTRHHASARVAMVALLPTQQRSAIHDQRFND